MEQKHFPWEIVIVILLFLSLGAAFFFGYQYWQLKQQPLVAPSPSVMVSPAPSLSPAVSPEVSAPAGWQIYTNTQYGFTLNYPSGFKALTDQDNLYGWPKAVVLFYGGGQSYDLPVEVWNSEAEYQQKYPGAANLTVYQAGSKFITLVNVNSDPMVDQIIASFKFVD